jgi:uncharacterized ParB-like nuclease family protein
MASYVINLCVALLVASTMLVTLPGATRAAGQCLDNREVQSMIAAHAIKTWPAIKSLAGISAGYSEVSPVRVCEQGGQPYYVVNVQGPGGEFKQLVLNAVDGSN